MTQKEVFELTIQRLEELQIQYMVCGSLGAMVYGEPRLTKDMDVVVAIPPSKIGEFHRIFSEDEFYCPPVEVLLEEFRRQGQFNLLHEETGVKIDFMFLKSHPFSREEFARRQRQMFTQTLKASVASPEDVIVKKLEFFKMGGSIKHLEDIRSMLRVSPQDIDLNYVARWVKELALEKEWAQVQAGH